MADVEELRRGSAGRLVIDRLGEELVSGEELDRQLTVLREQHAKDTDKLRAELDESYGEQIVVLKAHYEDTHAADMARLQRQITLLSDERFVFKLIKRFSIYLITVVSLFTHCSD